MADLLKKIIYTGVGIVTTASDKLTKNIEDISEKGDESREEGRKIFDEILDTTEAKKEEVEGKMKDIVTNIMKSLNIPTKDEFNQLVERLGALEDAMEKTPAKKTTSRAKKATTRAKSTARKTTSRAKKATTTTARKAKSTAKKATTTARKTATTAKKAATTTAKKAATTTKKATTTAKSTATKATNAVKNVAKDIKK